MITMTRRFYKTKSALQRPQILKLLSEAISDAEQSIERGTEEEYYIVEVVRKVSRTKPAKPPIFVEDVG